jgi:glucan biosynthesis protein C
MAGFFTALLIARYGMRRAAWNRFMRIVVPFVVGWMIVWPLVMFLAGMGYFGVERTLRGFASGRVFDYAGPMHLWFLEYLILLYLVAVVALALVRLLLSQAVRQMLLQAFRRIVRSPWAPLILAIPSFAAQLLMPNPWIEDPPGFVPVFRIVAVYAIPFTFGWMLYLNVDLLDVITRRAWLYTSLAVVASVAYRYSYYLPLDREVKFYLIRAVHSLDMWLLILGVAGLFLRYLSDHSAYRRYLCDSSYFLYIAHMPVILVFQLLLRDVPLPPLVKIGIALAGTIALLMPLYRYGVRPTFIGAVLNGRRYSSTIGPVVEGGPHLEDRRAQDAVH